MTNLKEEKCLIAYYSREGNNYVSGKIVNLPIGNTKVVANMIQEMTGGDVFRIDTVKSYPEDYTETTNVAKKELHDNARPELSSHVDNMDSYNVIFLGYPNWWGILTVLKNQKSDNLPAHNKDVINVQKGKVNSTFM